LLFSFFCLYEWDIDMQQNSYRRWITLAIISFSGGVSFDLAMVLPWRGARAVASQIWNSISSTPPPSSTRRRAIFC
jgi:hypothetical protein